MSKQVKQYIGTLQKRIFNQRAEIERLHKENETLTIQRNAWHLTAERVGEELQVARANAETLEIHLKDFRSRNKELQEANEGLAKQCEEFEAELYQAHNIRTEVAREIFEEVEKSMARVYNDFMFNRESVGMRAAYVVEFSCELDIAVAELKKKYTEGE